jgi:hypothetical protein
MKRFIEGEDRGQTTLLPDSLEDYVTADNPVRVVDSSLTNWTWKRWAFLVLCRSRPVGLLIIPRRC